MHRTQLLKLLNAYLPFDAIETNFYQQILSFVQNNENCFKKNNEDSHVTGSAWLVNKTGDHCLLMHHAKLNLWVQPGGHCDGDSDVLAVSIKEVQEETGIMGVTPLHNAIFDIDIHQIPARGDVKTHLHYDVRFLIGVESDEEIQGNHESMDLRWFGKDAALMPTLEQSVVRMHRKWINWSNQNSKKA